MSTHFRPRPPAATPSSPVRPSTARSTVRAVTPSPPDSLNKASNLQFPSKDMYEKTKSEGFLHVQNGGLGGSRRQDNGEEADFTTYFLGAAEVPGSSLQRGGIASERYPPVKARSRARSPKKRPSSMPTELLLHRDLSIQDQKLQEEPRHHDEPGEKEDMERNDDLEGNADWPDTPTPVSRSQQRAAYMSLGAPLPLFTHESKPDLENPHVRFCPVNSITTTRQTSAPPPSTQLTPPFPLPQQQRYSAHLTAHLPLHQPVPQKCCSPNDPSRHISLSAQSNVSGGTAVSKRSIFSIPGRDELERKKALVEADEGPFARAVSVQDLQARRRRISEGKGVGKEGEGMGERTRRGCGIGGAWCNVM
ncbi:Nn.00g025810.m01.CDS01 [Neocucurbitaria sp. VM-36]